LAIIPIALLLVSFLAYTYAHVVPPLRAARTPYFPWQLDRGPLLPAYGEYVRGALRLDFGTMPTGQAGRTVGSVIAGATVASLGLLAIALVVSVVLGLFIGLLAVRTDPPRVARWLAPLSTLGQAMPSFFIGSLCILAVFFYILWRPGQGIPLPIQGFGWDLHLVLPTLALVLRSTVQIAHVTAGLLEEELGKRHIVTARSMGHRWRTIRWHHALRSVLAPVILTIAGSFRLLIGELILVEWLFNWPGLGRLFAQSLIPSGTNVGLLSPEFLHPPIVTTVVVVFAALFLLADLIASAATRLVDPRLSSGEEGVGSSDTTAGRGRPAQVNWSLLLGGVLVLLVLIVSIAGPALAPHDPLEERSIQRIGGAWVKPGTPAFTVSAFPLGLDGFGRDILSRLLWAVRPTMLMVATVAAVRLVLGVVIGLASGWSGGRLGRLLDTAIAGALSLPVLIAALGVIAAVGAEIGLPAFIIGLSITGWGETARIVREQTRLVRGQLYVEAARALGLSDGRILVRHALRQILPMLTMLFAFEISGTLMATAGLGFLGYYIGGDLWVEVDDFITARISGIPELGQMLATSPKGLSRLAPEGLPWTMILTGCAIFCVVLGFNLLGEGLRRRLSQEHTRRETPLSKLARRAAWWIEDNLWSPLVRHTRKRPLRTAVVALLVVVGIGALSWWWGQTTTAPVESGAVLKVPGGHLWAAARHDAQGTYWTEAQGPTDAEVLWTFQPGEGIEFTGGPAVSSDGTIYITSQEGELYALDPAGKLLWQVQLAAPPVSTPALGRAGEVYVADKEAGLTAITPGGELRWRFLSAGGTIATTGPVVGPDGAIYYAVGKAVQAVSPDGNALGEMRVLGSAPFSPFQLDPTGERLFWKDLFFYVKDGSRPELDVPVEQFSYVVGADGHTYLRSGNLVMRWQMGAPGLEIVETANWNYRTFLSIALTPQEAGITGGGIIWLFYTNLQDTRVAWLEGDGRVVGTVIHPAATSDLLAFGGDATAFVCGSLGTYDNPLPRCFALTPGAEDPLWELPIEGEHVEGGALVPGVLYVVCKDVDSRTGFLHALGDAQP
jgi:ABC-type dipeptide/oligopeptide/nickel transport system permease subunit/outer membrane protein assembly factor BamB